MYGPDNNTVLKIQDPGFGHKHSVKLFNSIKIVSHDLDDTGIIGATAGQIHWDSDLDDTHHWDSRFIIEGSWISE